MSNQIALSSGPACASDAADLSYVLKAIGVRPDLASRTLRIGFGRFTTEEEVDYAIDLIRGVKRNKL